MKLKQPQLASVIHFIFKALLIFGLLFGLGLSTLMAQQTKYLFNAITTDNGLTHNTVFDICQDNKGFMWFATDGGLNRFDGQNLKQYYALGNTRSLPSNSVSSLIYTSDNKLFAGTYNGLALYMPETDDFQQITYKGNNLDDIIALRQGIGPELLISTQGSGALIYNYKDRKFSSLTFLKDRIFGMCVDKEGCYWAFSRYKLYRFDKTHRMRNVYDVSSNLFNSAISYILSDRKGVLWVGTFEKGLFTFNFQTGKFSPFASSNGTEMYYIRTIEEGEDPNEYWVGTEKGLYVLNIQSGYFQHYVQSFDENFKTINDNAIYKICRNQQNVYFVGTYFGGVNITKTQNIGFNAIYPNDKAGFLHGKAISTITKATDGKLWIATEDAGIAIFDKHNMTFKHLLADDKNTHTISTNNVHALLMDGDVCWAGHFMGGLSRIDIRSGLVKRYMYDYHNPYSLNNNFVFSLHFLSPDSILLGTIAGAEVFDKRTERFSRFRENELTDCFIYDIFTAPDQRIWICTYNKGIFVLDKNRRGLMTHFKMEDGSGLPGNSIISHCVDSKGRVWIGTRGAGLCRFDSQSQKFRLVNTQKMLLNNVIYGILEDSNGMLWVSSNKGISRLNLVDSTSTHFNFKHGIAGNQYNYKSYFKDADGVMYFGSVTGLTSFNPSDIHTSSVKPNVYFSNLKIFNEIIQPQDGGILSKQIDFCESVKLKYNQNSFTLEFSSVNYFDGDIEYQYYLEGFDQSWSPLSEKKQANYTNISPGNYLFHIRAYNIISDTAGEERTIQIVIRPPFWATWEAYIVYILLIAATIYFLYRNHQIRQKERMTLAIEKIEKQNLNILHQHKMNFFTYISHEFKTPLSIIIASVEMLFKRNGEQPDDIKDIHLSIKHSATRLLFLVNQLMEFRKIETDHAVLSIQKGNVIDFVNQIMGVYRPLLAKKTIQLNVKMKYAQTEIFFDFDKLEKIVTNLLTNAIKYTPQNGDISFSIDVSSEAIEFSVKDSGKGLNEIQKEKVFEVFYSEDFSTDLIESSGIGLALTAGLVKLLRGEISVESEQGKGCKFIVKLPFMETSEIISVQEKPLMPSEIPSPTDIGSARSEKVEATIPETNKEFTLVIVEDNSDLLMLLHKEFKDKYLVKCFENGADAWEYVSKKIPDIVITDIMMPIMSGTELCMKIKADVNLCHIPVIMLTAKATKEAKLEGLQMGADAYIAKPFSMAEIDVRLSNILTNRKILKNKLRELAQIEGMNIPATNHELAFMEKVFSLINSNIDKNELDVQFLANKLNISRTNLHNKIRTLMNMNTSEFINTVRINKAKELMVNETLTLSEISYKVGYSDSAYFTRIFKKITGSTPGEYRKNISVSKTGKIDLNFPT